MRPTSGRRRVLSRWALLGAVSLVALAAAGPAGPAGGSGPLGDYTIETQTGQPIIPGTTNIGNSCDDCTTPISLPFPVQLYDGTFNTANVSSNGTLQFDSNDPDYFNECLPTATFGHTIAPHWDDQVTNEGGGIFTATIGTPPNRVFVIEWREVRYFNHDGTATYEILLTEGSPNISVIYGATFNQGALGDVRHPAELDAWQVSTRATRRF